jgi:hypothetical protein
MMEKEHVPATQSWFVILIGRIVRTNNIDKDFGDVPRKSGAKNIITHEASQ